MKSQQESISTTREHFISQDLISTSIKKNLAQMNSSTVGMERTKSIDTK